MDVRSELVERFLRYTAIESQSDERSTSLPSTPGQLELAKLLAAEMHALGLDEVHVDDNAIVTGVKRANSPSAPTLGFIAHLDTADVGLSPHIRPQIKRFTGEDLCLHPGHDIWFRASEHPEVRAWRGHDIIFSDGTSVLGADNKAAIAIIMTLLSRLDPAGAHGDIRVAFVPDEEIGLRGAKALDLSRFQCDFAYTIDCCEVGEVVIETFNAADGEITFTGISAHPMAAKGVMVNPLLMAQDFIAGFDRKETPECTEEREGYFWFSKLVANDSAARLSVMVRDFDRLAFERRKQRIFEVAELVRRRYTQGHVNVNITDIYRNISDSLAGDRRALDLLLRAMGGLQITPKLVPMRGGTDGSALSARGLPTPNFFTGAHNFHSQFEFLPIGAFETSFHVARRICELAA
ncbi:tripeptide aminopeptidase [Ochrobactrum daejeonense]|uniref:Peptidase T n=1 Tax=Brucella daejeonensis TaxID=659015 RepID=A0A7W9B1N1_9HYPH|nr:peptidase T [Brucella daejeonensis]MBB5704600.1 tripeptide aminopeptidase [Brucella daejeonensis]